MTRIKPDRHSREYYFLVTVYVTFTSATQACANYIPYRVCLELVYQEGARNRELMMEILGSYLPSRLTVI
jgi:hypothetical protein